MQVTDQAFGDGWALYCGDAADVLTGLYAFHSETLGGIVPPLTFPAGRHDQVNQCAVAVMVKGGKFVALGGTEHFECAPGWTSPS